MSSSWPTAPHPGPCLHRPVSSRPGLRGRRPALPRPGPRPCLRGLLRPRSCQSCLCRRGRRQLASALKNRQPASTALDTVPGFSSPAWRCDFISISCVCPMPVFPGCSWSLDCVHLNAFVRCLLPLLQGPAVVTFAAFLKQKSNLQQRSSTHRCRR